MILRRTAVIVQARMGSARLPGKVLLEIGGRSALSHVLDRCRAIKGADIVICAMPDEPASKPLESIAAECGAMTFRGSETDVLDRYLGAARSAKADVVMRVTSDCPLIDPEICANVLSLREESNADYACNNMPRSFPHGLDCEVFTIVALERAARETNEPEDREHVTPWLRRDSGIRRENLSSGNPALATHRWTLDYPEDLQFFRALSDRCVGLADARMSDIVSMLDHHPEIALINRGRRSG